LPRFDGEVACVEGGKHALVTLASKLAVILHTMRIDGTAFCLKTCS